MTGVGHQLSIAQENLQAEIRSDTPSALVLTAESRQVLSMTEDQGAEMIPPEALAEMQAPHFIKPIEPQIAQVTGECRFEATVHGSPQPTIKWCRQTGPSRSKSDDGLIEILPSDKCTQDFDAESGVCSLVLREVSPDDVAIIACVASNLAGRASCTANLVVVRESFHFTTSSSNIIIPTLPL
jgi:hypothetical protein